MERTGSRRSCMYLPACEYICGQARIGRRVVVLFTSSIHYLIPHSTYEQSPIPLSDPLALRPDLSQPLIRLLRRIHIRRRPVEPRNLIASHIVQRVLLIRPGANRIRHRLHIISDLLIDHKLHILHLRVPDAILIPVVRIDDAHPRAVDGDDVLDGDVALRLVEAVAARLVEGAEVLGVEAGDVELAAEAVVLEDFVLGVAGAAAEDAELRVQAFGG